MIVSEQHHYVYIGIPKAGSQSVAAWLIDNCCGSPLGYHHSWKVPPAYEDYLVFTVVRDPYERCFSAWWFRCMEPARSEDASFGWSFGRFMRSVLAHRRTSGGLDPTSTAASLTQTQFVELSRAQLVLHIERPHELGLLPFVGVEPRALPRQNETRSKPHGSFHDHLSADDEHLVWEYCAEDFANFGYARRAGSSA